VHKRKEYENPCAQKNKTKKCPKKLGPLISASFSGLKKLGETPSTDMIPHKPHPLLGEVEAGAKILKRKEIL